MKVTAKSYSIQGLIKYHGIRDWDLVLPFHDSIAVCMSALYTTTTVEIERELREDVIIIDGREATEDEAKRVKKVLNAIRSLTASDDKVRIVSQNSLTYGKGLGFSSSAFASLGLALAEEFSLDLTCEELSEIVRLGSGSATKSLVGGFSIWYADKNGHSFAEQLAGPDEISLMTLIVPISSPVKTWDIHKESITSPFFKARLRHVKGALRRAVKAIRERNLYKICKLAEQDTLNLHSVSMTGKKGVILWEPETLRVIREVLRLRKEGIRAWFSIDTGPSVFINTGQEYVDDVSARIQDLGVDGLLISRVGSKAHLIDRHLF